MTTQFNETDHPRSESGKFTTKHHAEAAGVRLVAAETRAGDSPAPAARPAPSAFTDRQFTWLASDNHQMNVLKDISGQVREIHPDATAIRAKPSHFGSTTVEWRNANGPAGTLEQDDDREFYPGDIIVSASQVNEFAYDNGWMELDDIDARHEEVSAEYGAAVQQAVAATQRAAVADKYAQDLAREVSIQHRLANAEAEGETNSDGDPYGRDDAENYADECPEDVQDVAERLRPFINEQDGGISARDYDNAVAAISRTKQDRASYADALVDAEEVVPFQSGGPGTLYAAPGVEVTTYTGRDDGVPVIQVDTPGRPDRIRVNVNDGDAVFDGRTD